MPELFLVDSPQAAAPDRAAPPPPDADEREQALDIGQSWIVEAPAGSGKTGLLIQRYLKLLADPSVETPEQVLAITFTNKATTELRERVLGQLEVAASQENLAPASDFDRLTRSLARAVLARDRALGWEIIDQPHRLNIRTIDSVCAEIARSLPILSGHSGRQSPVSDPEPLYTLAARRTFLQLGGPDPALDAALRLILLHRDGNLADCEALLGEMLSRRDQWGELVPLGRRVLDDAYLDANILPQLEHALEQAISSALAQLAEAIPPHLLRQLAETAASMAHLEGYKGNPSPIALCSGHPGTTADDLPHWRALAHMLVAPSSQTWRKGLNVNHLGFMVTALEKQQLTALIQQFEGRDDLLRALCRLGPLPPATYPADQWIVAKALFRILNHALVELKLVFAQRGECDFSEIALAARAALAEPTGDDENSDTLSAALGYNLQHLLVDEMQDTSSLQYQLIERLTHTWDGHSQTVFLVGDPKQSIYLFRHARVERFLRTMRDGLLGDLPLGCLRLTANFRSQAALVEQFNADFKHIFPAELDAQRPEEVPFASAFPVRPPNHAAASRTWHPTVLGAADATTQDPVPNPAQAKAAQRQSEAAEIVRILAEWRSRPLPAARAEANPPKPWKIGVLVRNRSHLNEIVPALRAAGIPYRAIEIDALQERQEVLDLIALTRALLHPADRVAWLAVLRAPWCGLSLAQLHTLAGGDDPHLAQHTLPGLIDDRGDLLAPDGIARLERLWPILQAATAMDARLTTAQRVERTWRALGGDSYLGPIERANATQYLRLLDELEQQTGTVDLAQLERRLGKLFAAPANEPSAVDLMTIHKAKGLEWDLVLVPALERSGGADKPRLLSWLELDSTHLTEDGDITEDEDPTGAAHFLLAPIHGKGKESQALKTWIDSIHREREAAERKRLFYVACTRAREELHLFAAPSTTSKGEINPRPGTLLAAAWPAASPQFAIPAQGTEWPQLAAAEADAFTTNDAAFGLDLDLAAAAAEPPRENLLHRLPLDFDPEALRGGARPLPYGSSEHGSASTAHSGLFTRPEGSFSARAFGNAVHAFLEKLTEELAAGQPAASLLATLPTWTPRIAAILRSEGLPPAQVERLTQRVLAALDNTLRHPEGLWLLGAHTGAASEYALTAWKLQPGHGIPESRSEIRMDRIFRAGPEPLTPGDHCLWIVDYKTTTPAGQDRDEFLRSERERYAPQLEAYARILSESGAEATQELRLALYYPLLPQLIWWIPDGSQNPE
ncbi:MAG TPA: UvrD-helicase domain-containing protein [Granulicella sp.]|jgi:ATP-dependent helicase/nuclease subunit A|nr:UvrD-helicase domain-containing protein [Granulicella sp.]